MPDDTTLFAHFRAGAIRARTLDEFIGLCKGVIADGTICFKEAQFLVNWLEANKGISDSFPANVLYPRIVEMLADGKIDDAESKELLNILEQATGEQGQGGSVNMSTSIAFNTPLPTLNFYGQAFCLTGSFAYGLRKNVAERTTNLGGEIIKSVVKRGCVLVVGGMGSEAWLHSTHGTKIKKAVEDRTSGAPVIIVPEEHWHRQAVRAEKEQEEQSSIAAGKQACMRHAMQHLFLIKD